METNFCWEKIKCNYKTELFFNYYFMIETNSVLTTRDFKYQMKKALVNIFWLRSSQCQSQKLLRIAN